MIYLDHNSTSFMDKDSASMLMNYMVTPMNSSSIHFYGRGARQILEESRIKIAESLGIHIGARKYKIVFTSGATEANNLVISSFANGFDNPVVLYSAVEHLSVIEAVKKYTNSGNIDSHEIKVNHQGQLDIECLEDFLRKYSGRKNSGSKNSGSKILISVMAANNETGIIQKLDKIVELARKYEAFIHSDIVQIFGKLKFSMEDNDLDFATISSHKIGAMNGIGALIAKENIQLNPIVVGGGQERGERAGTEFVMGAYSFGVEASKITDKINEKGTLIEELRLYLEKKISLSNRAYIIGEKVPRLPNTSLIAMKGVDFDLQLIKFDQAGIALSNGSACSSGKVKTSHVLNAMGYNEDITRSVIRVSLGYNNTLQDVDKFVEVWRKIDQTRLTEA